MIKLDYDNQGEIFVSYPEEIYKYNSDFGKLNRIDGEGNILPDSVPGGSNYEEYRKKYKDKLSSLDDYSLGETDVNGHKALVMKYTDEDSGHMELVEVKTNRGEKSNKEKSGKGKSKKGKAKKGKSKKGKPKKGKSGDLKDKAESTDSSEIDSLGNKSVTFTFESLPESVTELQELPEATLDTPFKTAALTLCALCTYAKDEELGKEMLNWLKGPQPLSNYEIQFLKERINGRTYVPFSYFAGAKPENDYTPTEPFTVTISDNPYSYQDKNYAVMHLRSGGADNPRQIKLRKKGEQWFLWEQFVLVDIRAPKSSDPWE